MTIASANFFVTGRWLFTAYGLFTIKRWGRVLALIFSLLYVWVFPVGTLLAVYTFWFLLSDGGKSLYTKLPAKQPD